MSNLPVIAGTYYDLRQVKSRGCWQIVIDVQSADAEKLVETFGLPRQDEPTWLAVARLNVSPGASGRESSHGSDASLVTPTPAKTGGASGESKGGWYGLLPSARAALLCKSDDFLIWINKTYKHGLLIASEEHADEWLKQMVGTFSKACLNPDNKPHHAAALKKFLAIESSYRVSRGMETEGR